MPSASKTRYLSVIVPAYKAEKTIQNTLQVFKSALDDLGVKYEIICVVDGILDKTYDQAKKLASSKIRVFGYPKNSGKGHAVRFGMSKARGNLVAFIDDNGLDPAGLSMLLSHLDWYKADIIVASKRHPVSIVEYPWQRRVFSWGYQVLTRALFNLKIRDTQVGMKLFRRPVIEKILPRMLVKTYAFDIEMLAVAKHLGFHRIYEAPVEIKMEFSSSTIASKGFIRTIFLMTRDTLAVFYRLNILRYYDNANKKNWIKG